MIFIYGGGFVSGGSSDLLYNGSNLAASHDVIVVTINYRLNIFGFMNFAEIDSDFEDTGYLGIKDQVAALKWVKENISEFGGDPDNVTIFGGSAGAMSTMFLMVAPAAKNLFQKAVAQSGHLAFYYTPEASAEFTEAFMELGGYKNMQELMKTSSSKLIATYEKLCEERDFSTEIDYLPTCDGKYLPLQPLRAFKNGAAQDIKFLTGMTLEEYRYWILPYGEELFEHMADFHAELMPVLYEREFTEATEFYQAWQKNYMELDDDERYFEFANQLDWRVGQEIMAEYQSAFDDAYFYLFSQKSPVEDFGSCHSIDLPFVFGNPDGYLEPNPPANLVEQVQAAWVSFATSGKPNNDLISTWKKYSVDDRETMEINSKAWTLHKYLNSKNVRELRKVYEDYLLD